jgi:dTDP-4-dehydrorhamnose 3,5-epimerase
MIEGVLLVRLRQIADERGRVMHMLRKDSPLFEKFGEVYFSEIMPGVVKAWKRHKQMTQLITVPIGRVRIVIYDDREGSGTFGRSQTIEIGRDNYQLVKIPPMLWYGFQGISQSPALIANCPNLPHDPAEAEKVTLDDIRIPYQWPTMSEELETDSKKTISKEIS